MTKKATQKSAAKVKDPKALAHTALRPTVQNPPRDKAFRSVFAAASGRILVAADFSQIELRVAALLSKDTRMLNVYAQGQDLHRLTAAAVAGVAVGSVTPEQRQAAKAVNFGNLYQQRPTGLARYARNSYGVTMTKQEAAQAQQRFFRAYPQLQQWQLQQITTARVYGKVKTRTGLVRDFTTSSGYLEAEACNHPIQGSAGEILLAALKHLDTKSTGAQLYNHVHDEILLDVQADNAEQAAAELERAMVTGFLEIFPEGGGLTNGLVDVKQGRTWAEVK